MSQIWGGVAGRKAKANCKRWGKKTQEGLRMGLRNSVMHQKGASVTEKEKKRKGTNEEFEIVSGFSKWG